MNEQSKRVIKRLEGGRELYYIPVSDSRLFEKEAAVQLVTIFEIVDLHIYVKDGLLGPFDDWSIAQDAAMLIKGFSESSTAAINKLKEPLPFIVWAQKHLYRIKEKTRHRNIKGGL